MVIAIRQVSKRMETRVAWAWLRVQWRILSIPAHYLFGEQPYARRRDTWAIPREEDEKPKLDAQTQLAITDTYGHLWEQERPSSHSWMNYRILPNGSPVIVNTDLGTALQTDIVKRMDDSP